MKQYLFILGRNFALSKSEILNFCDEILSDEKHSLLLAENLQFSNPRNLPKSSDQIFLDRLGGTIRMSEVMGEFFSKQDLSQAIVRFIEEKKITKVGFSVFGTGRTFLPDFWKELQSKFSTKIRLENQAFKNMTSGQIFDRKLLKKGTEFIIWQSGNSFLLAHTKANQNLRNYVLRDRTKPFRDAKMGMLPPKLAQILINLANPKNDEVVIDPFCGSGTVCAEAAIMGFRTIGSDMSSSFINGAKQNFEFLAEKFRYDVHAGNFEVSRVEDFNFQKYQGVIVTEGFLGKNFDSNEKISPNKVTLEAERVLEIWEKVFVALQNSPIKTMAFCIPFWKIKPQNISIFSKIKKIAEANNFKIQKDFLYEREQTLVARQIVVAVKL